jgi:predicted  nucleic acid-binding Zn-ribbon protein
LTAKKLYMNGHTCLNCGKGFYDGYDAKARLTQPCKKCGHQAPDRMLPSEFKKAYQAPDQRLYG